jgi:hypothetical protein
MLSYFNKVQFDFGLLLLHAQVYFVCGTYSQPRVLVKDDKRRTISIPRNYAGTFDIVTSNGRPTSGRPILYIAKVKLVANKKLTESVYSYIKLNITACAVL